MVVCAQCQTANPDGAGACAGCGHALVGVEVPLPVAVPGGKATGRAGGFGTARPGPSAPPTPTPGTPPPGRSLQAAHQTLLTGVSTGTAPDTVSDRPPNPRTDRPTAAATSVAPMPEGVVFPPPGSAPAPAPAPVPPEASRMKLVAIRGQRLNQEYPIYEGRNTIGRFADRPVDIDLISQEAEGQIWSSRQHAVITCDQGVLHIEDLNSLNGTWVNGVRINPGHPRELKPADVIQIGTVQLKVIAG